MRKRIFWLTVAFVFTIPWEAAVNVGGIGRISKVVGLVTAAVWVVSVVVRGRIRKPDGFVMAYFLFLLWSGLTLFWSIDPSSSYSGLITYLQIFGMILILWDLFETQRQISVVLQAFVLGAYVSCASLIVNWVTAPPTRFPEHQRINALGFETDGIALIVALAMPAAWYLAAGPMAATKGLWVRLLNFAYLPAALFGIILTATRGAAIASVPTIAFILWSSHTAGYTRRVLAWVLMAAAVALVIMYAPREPLQRIAGAGQDVLQGDSLSGRTEIWAEGITVFYDHPIAGIGLDSFRAASSFDKEAHNTPLSILVETGLVGFAIAGAAIMSMFARTLRMKGWVGWYWNTQLTVAVLGSLSLSLEDSKSIWALFILAVAAAAAVRRERAEVDQPATPVSRRLSLIGGP